MAILEEQIISTNVDPLDVERGGHRREPAGVADQGHRYPEKGGPSVARRRAAAKSEVTGSDESRQPSPRFTPGHRAGVVKPLRARGGCLGVVRIRAWKAAKSPGELPNERRSRNTREDPGN